MNVHHSNDRVHALLQNDDDYDILLIQEPWFHTVAMLHSDKDPKGHPQLGTPINNKWDLHLPKHNMGKLCKVITYSKKKIASCVHNLIQHPLSGLSIILLNILEQDIVALQVVNVYHNIPTQGHGLHPLFSYNTDELTPMLFIGDFNTHSLL